MAGFGPVMTMFSAGNFENVLRDRPNANPMQYCAPGRGVVAMFCSAMSGARHRAMAKAQGKVVDCAPGDDLAPQRKALCYAIKF